MTAFHTIKGITSSNVERGFSYLRVIKPEFSPMLQSSFYLLNRINRSWKIHMWPFRGTYQEPNYTTVDEENILQFRRSFSMQLQCSTFNTKRSVAIARNIVKPTTVDWFTSNMSMRLTENNSQQDWHTKNSFIDRLKEAHVRLTL